jgi:hypothetical protein
VSIGFSCGKPRKASVGPSLFSGPSVFTYRNEGFTLILLSRSLCSVLSSRQLLTSCAGAGLAYASRPTSIRTRGAPGGPVLVGVRLLVSRCCPLIYGLSMEGLSTRRSHRNAVLLPASLRDSATLAGSHGSFRRLL